MQKLIAAKVDSFAIITPYLYNILYFIGYWANDPYQFVNLAFIPRKKAKASLIRKKLGDEHVTELLKYFGMNTAFISTVAQAYNQGI